MDNIAIEAMAERLRNSIIITHTGQSAERGCLKKENFKDSLIGDSLIDAAAIHITFMLESVHDQKELKGNKNKEAFLHELQSCFTDAFNHQIDCKLSGYGARKKPKDDGSIVNLPGHTPKR